MTIVNKHGITKTPISLNDLLSNSLETELNNIPTVIEHDVMKDLILLLVEKRVLTEKEAFEHFCQTWNYELLDE